MTLDKYAREEEVAQVPHPPFDTTPCVLCHHPEVRHGKERGKRVCLFVVKVNTMERCKCRREPTP